MNRLAAMNYRQAARRCLWRFCVVWCRSPRDFKNFMVYIVRNDLCCNLNGIGCMIKFWIKGVWVII